MTSITGNLGLREKSIINSRIKRLIESTLNEDINRGDITTTILYQDRPISAKAWIKAKEDGVLAGLDVVETVFKIIDPQLIIKALFKDGDHIKSGEVIMTIHGNITSILQGERTSLNFLQHLSSIASATNKYVASLEGTNIKILDTRKTMPLLRELQKYAVTCGGGQNHRMSLNDMVLIKENHISGYDTITNVLRRFKNSSLLGKRKIEIEIEKFEQLSDCLENQPDFIMLDNMTHEQLEKCITYIREMLPNTKIEISGGVNLNNIHTYRDLDVDYISVGALTHSVKAMDYSLLLEKEV